MRDGNRWLTMVGTGPLRLHSPIRNYADGKVVIVNARDGCPSSIMRT